MRPAYFALLLITLFSILAFLPVFSGEFYAVGDIRDVYIPIESFFHQQQLLGRLPAWMPDAAWGFPVIGSAQIGFFYPPLLILRFLPLPVYLPLTLILHFVWLSYGTYLFLRSLKTSNTAALLGSLSFAFGGFLALHLTHLNIIMALSWFPWQLLICHRLSRQAVKFKSILLLALIFGIPFLVGQLQIPTLTAIISSLWFISLRYRYKYSIQSSLGIISLLAVCAILFAAAQLLPSLELMSLSTRSSVSSFDTVRANQHSYPLYHLPTLLFPRFYANDDTYWGKRLQIEYGFYLGTLPLIFALIGIYPHSKKLFARRNNISPTKHSSPVEHKFFFWLLIITFLLALGSLSPFRLIKFEPSLWVFSAPARWLLFTSFSFAVFTALGFDNLIKRTSRYKTFIFSFLGFILIVFAVANIFLFAFDNAAIAALAGQLSPSQLKKIQSLFSSAQQSSISFKSPYSYLPIMSMLLFYKFLNSKQLKKITLFIIAAELLTLFIATTPTLPWSEIINPPSSINQLPKDVATRQSRIYAVRDGGDTGAYFTNPDSRADTVIRDQQRRLFVPLTHSLFSVPGIEWPASLDLSNHSALLENLKVADSYAIADPLLAAELNIGAVLSVSDDKVNIEVIEHRPRIEIADDTNEQSVPYPGDQHPSRLSFSVNTDTDTSVIVRDSYYPGWHAFLDNREIPIHQYLLIFRRVFIPAGRHNITFLYKPTPLYLGIILSSSFLIVLITAYIKEVASFIIRSRNIFK